MARTLIATRSRFGEKLHVTHRAHRGVTHQTHRVELRKRCLDGGNAEAIERDQLHVGARGVHQQIGDAVGVLAGPELHIGAEQIGITDRDGVVARQSREGATIGTRDSAPRPHVGRGGQIGIGAGGDQHVATEVSERGTRQIDAGDQIG